MDEIAKLLEDNPEASAYHAIREMHYGRLEWLAEHIRMSNFQINPLVAKKLLNMLEGSDEGCLFQFQAVRKEGLPPRASDARARMARDFDMAVEFARLGGFKRAYRQRAAEKVAEKAGLSEDYVLKRGPTVRQQAQEALAEEEAEAACQQGIVDILGQPKSP